MLFFPYNTDAPIYHYPIAPITLIAACALVFFGTLGLEEEQLVTYYLIHGEVQPLQWLTSSFLHADFLHLLGNMLFLWVFGLVAEGKLGWFKFLPFYLGMSIFQNATEQFVALAFPAPSIWGAPSASLGASAAIFGVMAMAVVWAPKNTISCALVYWITRTAYFEVSILGFACFFVCLDLIFFALGGFSLTSAAMRLM